MASTSDLDDRSAAEDMGPISISSGRRAVPHVVGGAVTVALVGGYILRAGMTPMEAARLVLGSAALWGPFALGVNQLIRRQVPDRAARIALALGGSYALTTSAYFLWSVIGAQAGFYATQVIVLVIAGRNVVLCREEGASRTAASRFPNWTLLGLIGLALLVTAPYSRLDDVTPIGSHQLRIPADSLYYTSQAYELAREVPPTQDPTRAGTPPRSYHLLPHLTTVLLARYTAEPDLLRSQLVFHLPAITILVSVLLYALGKTIAGRRLGGYALVALLYPLAVYTPPMLTDTTLRGGAFVQFYFTPLPVLSSILDPAALGSWQTYSAAVVILAVLLAIAVASDRLHAGVGTGRVLLLCGLTVGTLARFRAQAFFVALPGFLLVAALVWWRQRERITLAAAASSCVVSAALVVEALSSRYRPGSSGLGFGYNGLTDPAGSFGRTSPEGFLTAWPFSRHVHGFLDSFLAGSGFAWTWQAVCLTAFVLLNMVGVLLLSAAVYYVLRRDSWERLWPFSTMVLVMVVGSVFLAVLVKSEFDSYSLSGQALYLPPWYLLPLASAAVVGLDRGLRRMPRLSTSARYGIGLGLVAVGAAFRIAGPTSRLASFEFEGHIRRGDTLSADRWSTLRWLREQSPTDAVMISSEYVDYRLVFSGIAGRAAFLEGLGDIQDTEAQRLYGDDRISQVAEMWTTRDQDRFCKLLHSTPSTHLIDFRTTPLRVKDPPCLAPAWRSPRGEVRVWTVR